MPFLNNNLAAGIPVNAPIQVGVSDTDSGTVNEQGITIPWPTSPVGSWVYYDCTISAMLDSGIVVHSRLPQVNNSADTLASCFFDQPKLENQVGGVNLNCQDQYRDIVQRMGHARYWFRIWGQALRVGQRIPIPGIKTIGGQPAVPYDQNPQWAFNRIVPRGNYGGIPLWMARWSLWYTIATPPTNKPIPSKDPSAGITDTTAIPSGVQVPISQPDTNATATSQSLEGFITTES